MASEKEEMEIGDVEEEEDDSLSSGNSEDEEAENRNLYVYLQALQNISTNKYSYNDYIQLVDAAFVISDLDKIREAYDLFASVFPIAPQLWMKRLKIEASLASTQQDMEYVDQLFKKALSDYYSPEIALDYAEFLSKQPNPSSFWNTMLIPYAFDCMKGGNLYKLWRESVISNVEESPDKVLAIHNFYLEEIDIPLYNLDEAFLAFKEFFEKHKEQLTTTDWTSIEEKYQKTRKTLQKILPYEKKLQQIDKSSHQERSMVFKEYIEMSKSELNPKILIVLYERMATECCLDTSVWLEYLTFLDEYSGIADIKSKEKAPVFQQTRLDLVTRALRNCTWSRELYIEKMRTLELKKAPREAVQAVIEEAAVVGFQTPSPIVNIWLEYLSYLSRNTDYQNTEEREHLRRNFQFSWDTLGRDWGALADVECKILQYWSKLEYGKLGSAIKGRDLWYTVMESANNASKASLWIEFAYLELQRGLEPARKIYKRAVSTPNVDDLQSVVSSWIQFERCYGTLQQLKACENYCLPILAYHLQKKSSSKSNRKGHGDQEKPSKSGDNQKTSESKPTKRKNAEEKLEANNAGGTSEESSTKKKKLKSDVEQLPGALEHVKLNQDLHKGSEGIDTSKDDVTVFFSNLNYGVTEERIRIGFPELPIKSISLIKNATGKTRGYGYIELESELDVQKAISLDRKELDGRPVYISKINRDKEERKKFKYAETLEPNKLFVKGLPFEMTKEEIENMFKPYGQLKDVRLVLHKSGKSKGFAYVDFEKDSDAGTALMKLDQTDVRGNKVSVAISAPPPRGKPHDKPETSSRPVNLGGAKRTNTLSEAKPRISLIPTAVQKKALENKAPADSKPKTNEEFRKLLLNK